MHRVKRKVPSQSHVLKILEEGKKIEKGKESRKTKGQKQEDGKIHRDTEVMCREAYWAAIAILQQHTVWYTHSQKLFCCCWEPTWVKSPKKNTEPFRYTCFKGFYNLVRFLSVLYMLRSNHRALHYWLEFARVLAFESAYCTEISWRWDEYSYSSSKSTPKKVSL